MFSTSLPDAELRRTARQTLLPGFGLTGQERLHAAHVFVIGAGGLGCPIMQQLAAAGVGHITVVDDDTVSLNNTHRQILFGASDVGRVKVEVTAERLRELQPGITVSALNQRLTAENAVELLDGVDLLIDGSDNFATKFLAADAAEVTGTPLVWGTVLRFRGDVALWWSGPGSPDGRGVGLRDLFPSHPDPADVPDCATAGVLGVTTSVVGGLMSTEAIKFLTGVTDSALSLADARLTQLGSFASYDALGGTIQRFKVGPDPQRELVTTLAPPAEFPRVGLDASLMDLVRSGAAVALDVRELGERALTDLPVPSTHLPSSGITDTLVSAFFDSVAVDEVVVYCASGGRSSTFVDNYAAQARLRGITLHSLPGGTNAHGVAR